MNELAKDVKSSKEKGWFTLENQEKLFEAGIVVFKLLLTRIKNRILQRFETFSHQKGIVKNSSLIEIYLSVNRLSFSQMNSKLCWSLKSFNTISFNTPFCSSSLTAIL